MAIQFARTRFISRATGGNAVRSAAYNQRTDIRDQRTGQNFYFRHREAPLHHEVLLPVGADAMFRDATTLWNAVEAAENRRNSQVALEMILALPANLEITEADRLELARTFVHEHFVSKGLAAQIDIHAPHEGDLDSETANWHAHVLVTTRRIEGDRLATHKARDLNPEVRRYGGKSFVMGAHGFGEAWRQHQDAFFRAHGYEARVDPTVSHPTEHLGPVRMRRRDSELNERAADADAANHTAARDPLQVLAALTRNNATFSERDLERYLAKHVKPPRERDIIKAAVLRHGEVLALHDRESGAVSERYTTRTVREQEHATLVLAVAVAGRRGTGVAPAIARATAGGTTLRADQRAAYDHAVAAGGLKLIEGRAGTGKSYTLSAIRVAHERDGYQVVGLGPTNAVALDLKASGFAEARTLHAALFRLKNGRERWSERTVVIVDEAAMVDTRILHELLSEVHKAGARLILAGDDRQLASIERGGLFSELRQAHGSVEITEVTRQREVEQKQAARDLAEGRFRRAVETFDRIGAITWSDEQSNARDALVAAWAADVAADPASSRFVFAYTNDDVDVLNTALRAVRRRRGELGADVALPTRRGMTNFAVGDRVQFTDTDKAIGVVNGHVGRITRIERLTQRVTVQLDGAGGEAGRTVSWTGASFSGVRHGYAGTIYKGQGKTLDHTYLYHTRHWRNAASYVALTRQRDSAQIFVARETAGDVAQLARQMARSEMKDASMAYATAEEITLERTMQEAAQQAGQDQQPDQAAVPVTAPPPARARVPARVVQGWVCTMALPRDPQALQAHLRTLDEDLLQELIASAYASPTTDEPITLTGIARQVDATYDAAAAYAERLRQDQAMLAAETLALDATIRHAEAAIVTLDQHDGLMRRVMRGMNLVENREVTSYRAKIELAVDRRTEVAVQLESLAPELADAERAEAQAYQRIDGDLEQERAERHRLSAAAIVAFQEQRRAREQHAQHEVGHEHDRNRDLEPDRENGIEF
ncbi:AAA family ATPase [Lichenicoccus roseus]|uniref:MobA/MobL protein domain-containing protein n=1 Tax=Lichenicoccus roseus TaxID=2683649 RepID=A0A5R9JAD2_9PROT|nr:AAA family ATPase [Lichenicoccus roseus]TLU71168.1 hypothetical protein FE263_18535 [Lichenicoccus roseus]